MKRKNWSRWLKNRGLEKYNYASNIYYEDGNFTVILENFEDKFDKKKIKLRWKNIYSYTVANESYREDIWIAQDEDYWPFYKLKDSPSISNFKSVNTIYQDYSISHYIIVGEEVLDILASEDPDIVIIDNSYNTIREFSEISGEYVDNIKGQTRFGYYLSENEDFYDIADIMKYDGRYKGSIIKFYDFETGNVYTPFELEKNIQYSSPVYINNSYYFLRADYTKKLVTIYEYYPEKCLNQIENFKMEELNLYNLGLVGEDIHLISQDDKLEIYYPFRKSVDLKGNETAIFIRDDKIFISAWIEEGWDEENDVAGANYEYYNKIFIKDMNGKIISERRGDLIQHIDGIWWII